MNESVRMGIFFSVDLMIQKKYFHIDMEASATGVIICFVVCFQTTHFFVVAGVWGHESGGGSVGMGAFFSENLFSKHSIFIV